MELQLPTDSIHTKLIRRIEACIKGTKYENHVYVVGGAVRDILLGRPIQGLDLFVTHLHEDDRFALWLTNKCCCFTHDNPTTTQWQSAGKFYDTSILQLTDDPSYSHVKISVVAYTNITQSLLTDAKERDLTINALYYNISSHQIVDPSHKGLDDLYGGILRTFEEPNELIEASPINMLRVIRFASELGWNIDKELWLAIMKRSEEIIAEEQALITYEMSRLLLGKHVGNGLRKLYFSNLLKFIIPKLCNLVGMNQGSRHTKDAWNHTIEVVENTPRFLPLRYAALLHDIGKQYCITKTFFVDTVHFNRHEIVSAEMANEILLAMGYSKNSCNIVGNIIKCHTIFADCKKKRTPTFKSVKKFLETIGGDAYVEYGLELIRANNETLAPRYQLPDLVPMIRQRIEAIKKKEEQDALIPSIELPITGKDLMAKFGLKSSPLIGKLMNKMKIQLFAQRDITKEDCFAIAEEELQHSKSNS